MGFCCRGQVTKLLDLSGKVCIFHLNSLTISRLEEEPHRNFPFLFFFSLENKDESLFESDIKLLFEQQLALKFARNIDDNTINFKRGISNDKDKLWPGGILPYEITEDLSKI